MVAVGIEKARDAGLQCEECGRRRRLLRWWLGLNLAAMGFTVLVQVVYYFPAIVARLVEGPLAAWVPAWQWMWADGHGLLWGPPLLMVVALLAMPRARQAFSSALPAIVLWVRSLVASWEPSGAGSPG